MKKKKKKNIQGGFIKCVSLYILSSEEGGVRDVCEYGKINLRICESTWNENWFSLFASSPSCRPFLSELLVLSRLWKGNDLLKNNETEIVCSMLAECLVCAWCLKYSSGSSF